ncbi:MAG: DUF4139 domain-containing protein [Sulfurovum sp.]|nr:DUF4139 domain-containing protein [Sulfurovum sp.]
MTKILRKNITLLMLMIGFVFASSLEIYQDVAKYRMIPTDRYVGFARDVSATCDGQSVALLTGEKCSDAYRLCKERDQLRILDSEKTALLYESETLEKLIEISKPTEVNANKWIEAANKIGKQKADLWEKQREVSAKLQSKKLAFSNQAPSKNALFLQKRCTGELELTMPSGHIGAKLLYEADVSSDDKIQVKQYLVVSNHSGIDVVAKDLYVYAKSYRVYLQPQQFSPWIARIQQDRPIAKRSMQKNAAYDESASTLDAVAGGDIAAVEPTASMGAVIQTGYKNYHVSGVELPSTGEEIKIKIADYQAVTECQYVSYPFMDSRVYRACSFIPLSPIESHKWRIQKDKRLVSDQAYGEYREGKYLLNVDIDDEVLVERKSIVKRDRSTGIFGGSIKKKDGFEIAVNNISDKVKKIQITERIPTSSTDKIKVKLLKVEGADSHKILKDGRLDMSVTLAPKEHKKIKIMFEINYDKETKVRY